MRASRLVSIILLLQARGRMTAHALAAELEVSVRTIYRDIEALHASGVPLHGEAGHDGGYRLVAGYRTQLTGLTGDEASALPLSMLPSAAAELGLGTQAAAAAAKIRAALTDDLRARADHVQRRLYVDAPGWYADDRDTEWLGDVADAVWHQRRLRVRYKRWKAPYEIERTLEPFGLVLKGGRWYVMARADGALRTYRVSSILAAYDLGEHFERPDDFDLAAHWRTYLADFAERRYTGEARVRLSPRAVDRLHHVVDPALVRAVLAGAGEPDEHGWCEVTIPIESVEHAHGELLRLGVEVEVLTPAALRDAIRRTAGELARRYASA